MTGWQVFFLVAAICFFAAAIIKRRNDGEDAVRLLVAGLVAMLFVVLTACSTPATKIQTVEVKIPVAVQPIRPAQVPVVPKPLGPRPQSLSAAADLLLAKHCEFVAYALKADPLLRLSAGMQQQQLAKFTECEGR